INSGGLVTGDFPGFADFGTEDFHLAEASPCINAGTSLHTDVLPDHDVLFQYVRHCQHEARPYDGIFDIGAFEYQNTGIGNDSNLSGSPFTPIVYRSGSSIVFSRLETGTSIRVYDTTGRLRHSSGEIAGDEYYWNVDNVLSGIYLYLIEGDDANSGKFIVMR
ncbi:MAG: T9SS type A sorting domain-containing protein, partial [Candidatus Aegiribacteria sp.]|nr:T9SS type A sorting domain-containing protein [Candidatus Aegiribacteria sp.]